MTVANPWVSFRHLGREHWLKAGLLFTWFFLAISAFWLLKPVRVASLLTRLGAAETPYLKIGSMIAVGIVVSVYARVVDRVSRRNLAVGIAVVFAAVFVVFWALLHGAGEAVRANRPFVYSFYILTDVYSTVMVAVFWTYTNDVVRRSEADVLYGPIGLGGILGGIVGGVGADVLARPLGPSNLLLVCAALALACGGLAIVCESVLKPPPRMIESIVVPSARAESGWSIALGGAREVARSRYLGLLVGILVAYEFASTMNDFAINVTFEHAFHGDPTRTTQMYGRLGWVISVTALVAQLGIVPLVLPKKRVALLVVPLSMTVAAIGMLAVPMVLTVFVLAASDNGLSYSVQQSTKETLYVPLTDAQKYKAKAFIDMFVQRAAKALASIAFIGVTAAMGLSLRVSLAMSLVALGVWVVLATSLARRYEHHVNEERRSEGLRIRRPMGPPAAATPV